jgi:hypothetical protein
MQQCSTVRNVGRREKLSEGDLRRVCKFGQSDSFWGGLQHLGTCKRGSWPFLEGLSQGKLMGYTSQVKEKMEAHLFLETPWLQSEGRYMIGFQSQR